jgi:hypothetical protein
VLPDKFVAGCIIAKLPQAWTDFATSLKHKRHEFGIAEFIGSLDVEEKTRAARTFVARKLLREVLVPMWCKKILKSPTRRNSSKNSNKRTLHLLRRRTRKKEIALLVANLGIMLRIAWMLSGS